MSYSHKRILAWLAGRLSSTSQPIFLLRQTLGRYGSMAIPPQTRSRRISFDLIATQLRTTQSVFGTQPAELRPNRGITPMWRITAQRTRKQIRPTVGLYGRVRWLWRQVTMDNIALFALWLRRPEPTK